MILAQFVLLLFCGAEIGLRFDRMWRRTPVIRTDEDEPPVLLSVVLLILLILAGAFDKIIRLPELKVSEPCPTAVPRH